MNSKLQHFLAEAAQLSGALAAVASFPGIAAVSPAIGVAGAVMSAIATALKPFAVANVAAQTPPPAKAI